MDIPFIDLSISDIVQAVGYLGLFAIIFAESGLIIGFFLPGASLLFTAGLLASQGFFNVYLLAPMLALAAILGDTVGYWFGAKVGPRIFSREDSYFFHKKHLEKTRAFYERYGSKAVLLARFVPVVRTFVPILAGVGKMEYSLFLRYNVIGGVLWSIGVTALGYFLGAAFPQTEKFLFPIILVIIFITLLPLLSEFKSKIFSIFKSKQ